MDGPQREVSADDDELFSATAAAERTALAWERTGFSVAAVGALLVHAGGSTKNPWALGSGVVTFVVALLIVVVLAPLRYRLVVRTIRQGGSPTRPGPLSGLVLLIVLVCVVALSSAAW